MKLKVVQEILISLIKNRRRKISGLCCRDLHVQKETIDLILTMVGNRAPARMSRDTRSCQI